MLPELLVWVLSEQRFEVFDLLLWILLQLLFSLGNLVIVVCNLLISVLMECRQRLSSSLRFAVSLLFVSQSVLYTDYIACLDTIEQSSRLLFLLVGSRYLLVGLLNEVV